MDALRVKFWGTRGIIPSPRKSTSVYGGNTSCIQIIHKNEIVIVDTGYGVALLGEKLLERIIVKRENLVIHIFFTHFHWDHVLGLPFFHPIYFPNTQLHLYAPLPEKQIWKNLNVLFDGSYSPFSGIDSMPSKITLHHLKKPITLADMKISFIPVEHHIHGHEKTEGDSYAYRFEADKKSVVIACDHEAKESETNDKLVEFAKNTNILIHDAQYTDKDVLSGWGHSTVAQALDNAVRIQPGLTLLTHHDPEREDDEIDALDAEYKAKAQYKNLKFEFAREGILFDTASY